MRAIVLCAAGALVFFVGACGSEIDLVGRVDDLASYQLRCVCDGTTVVDEIAGIMLEDEAEALAEDEAETLRATYPEAQVITCACSRRN